MSKKCSKCGESKEPHLFSRHSRSKDRLRTYCKTCGSVALKEWRRTSSAHKVYLERTREQRAGYLASYYQEHSDAIKEASEVWRMKNQERSKKSRRSYYQNNKEYFRKKYLEYYAEHKQDYFDRAAARRASRRSASVEAVSRETVFRRDAGLCGICGEGVDPGHWHLDHIVPLSRGGQHSYANVQVAHPGCNLSKGASMPEEVI